MLLRRVMMQQMQCGLSLTRHTVTPHPYTATQMRATQPHTPIHTPTHLQLFRARGGGVVHDLLE